MPPMPALTHRGTRPRLAGPRGRPARPPTATCAPRPSSRWRRRRRSRACCRPRSPPRLRHGARQHLPPLPRPGRTSSSTASAACTASWAGTRPIITDSGGFQVFSMGHGTVADEVKGRSPDGLRPRRAACSRSRRRACASAPTSTARERFMGPETSMEVQAALHSDLALVFDECTPFHVDRDYTARSTERTHRWLRRCLDWHAAHGPGATSSSTGSCRAACYEDLRVEPPPSASRPARCDGIAIGGSLGADKAQMHEVVGWTTAVLDRAARSGRAICWASATSTTSSRGVELGIDTFDCAMPTRLGPPRRGARPRPRAPLARRPHRRALQARRRADLRGLPVPGVRARALARLPALPRARPRAHGHAPADDPQPRVRRAC